MFIDKILIEGVQGKEKMAEYRLYVPEEFDHKIRKKVGSDADSWYELILNKALASRGYSAQDLEGITVTECSSENPTETKDSLKDSLVHISQELFNLVDIINEDIERMRK